MEEKDKDKLLSIDWDFKDAYTTDLTHSIHSYHAKFIPQIPNTLINILTKKGDVVLDPFCGSGTTLVEALRLNRNCIGVDNSPLSCLLSEVKTTKIDKSKLENYVLELIERMKGSKKIMMPDFPNEEVWFTRENLNNLGKIWCSINHYKDQNDIYNLFCVVFSSILKSVANYKDHWNWTFIGDNVLPNKQRNDIDVFKIFEKRLKKAKDMILSLSNIYNDNYKPRVYQMDAKQISTKKNIHFDLMITSPPYPCAVDFNRYYRLTYYWFEWDINKYRNEEIGARSKRGKRDVIEIYKKELSQCIKEIYTIMKKNSYSCFVIGDTRRKNKNIDAVTLIKEICGNIGFKFYIELARNISKQCMGHKRIKCEKILIFNK